MFTENLGTLISTCLMIHTILNKLNAVLSSAYTIDRKKGKREMVLSPNDGKVASWKKNSQFKTRVHKPYPISDQNGRNL